MTLPKIFTTLLTALVLVGAAQAQELTRLLPQESVLALGVQGLAEHQDKLQGFVDEFERLEVGEALSQLIPDEGMPGEATDTEGATEGMNGELEALEATFEGLTVYDLLGREAWLALSVSPFNPLPAATVITRLSPEAADRFSSAPAPEGARSLQEGEFTFFEVPLDDPESPVQVIAYAQADDLLVVSTNPEVLRGVLRRLGGGGEPSLADSEAFQQVFGRLESGNFYSYLNYAQIADAAESFVQGLGFDPLVDRLVRAFRTAGVFGSVTRFTDEGFSSERFQAVNREGGDEALYVLLTNQGEADLSTVDFAPTDVLTYSSSEIDLNGWWQYLNSLAATVPELGGDLNSLVLSFTGVDLQTTFFDWAGPQLSTVTTGLAEAVQPGMPADNLLGEMVYLFGVRNEEAARQGLQTLFQNLSQSLAAFSDPSGAAPGGIVDVDEVAGVTVSSYDISPGLSLSYALADGYALIATSRDAMRAALEARQSAANEELRNLLSSLPEGAHSVAYSNDRATLEGTARQLSSQFQLMAGLSGAEGLDFEAVSEASQAIEQFLLFVAERFGTSLGYGERSPEGIYGQSVTTVNW